MQLIAALLLAFTAAPASPDSDVLGDITVEAAEGDRAGPHRMKIAVAPTEGVGPSATLAGKVVLRDLELSGQFRIMEPQDTSVEALLRTSVVSTHDGNVELRAAVYFDPTAAAPAYEMAVTGSRLDVRERTHALVDAVIGILTGYRGPFVSRLTFVLRRGDTRSVYAIDADGHGLHRVTAERMLAGAATLGPDDAIYYSASVDHGRFRVYREGRDEPFAIDPPGSVYGIAFSPERDRVALTIAVGADVRLFTGPSDFSALRRESSLSLVLSPAFGPDGRLAVAATNGQRPRIRVDGRAKSPRGATASSPSFCDHPDGVKLVYALGARERSYVVVSDGRTSRRVSRSSGRDSHPACSPDGRLIAFFSTRKSGEGPGLYVMRTDGYFPRKIADVVGDSLQWSRRADAEGVTMAPATAADGPKPPPAK